MFRLQTVRCPWHLTISIALSADHGLFLAHRVCCIFSLSVNRLKFPSPQSNRTIVRPFPHWLPSPRSAGTNRVSPLNHFALQFCNFWTKFVRNGGSWNPIRRPPRRQCHPIPFHIHPCPHTRHTPVAIARRTSISSRHHSWTYLVSANRGISMWFSCRIIPKRQVTPQPHVPPAPRQLGRFPFISIPC